MGTASGPFSARSNIRFEITYSQSAYNIAGNYTPVSWAAVARLASGSASWFLTAGGGGSVNLNGNVGTIPPFIYDFRSTTSVVLATGVFNITHNADGTQYLNVSGSVTAPGTIGSASASGGEQMATIPRASTPTFSAGSVAAGSPITIQTHRASTAFTHTLKYSFGSASGIIETGVGDSSVWTPPLSLLSQIPDTRSGSLIVICETNSGSTLIGTKSVPLTLTVPSTVLPTFSTVTVSEAVSSVSTIVGAFVQSLSKFALAITGAAGIYGSSIAEYKIEVAGQSVNAVSGTTPSPINTSGTVVVKGTVTDSRGSIFTKSVNITVLPYTQPKIISYLAQRALSDGTLNSDGTYINVKLNASVQSLMPSTSEKNTLTYMIRTRPVGSTTWTTKATTTPAGIAFNSSVTFGTYPINASYDIEISVTDKFRTNTVSDLVSTSKPAFHIGVDGVGIEKIHERGSFDALGQGYQNNGKAILDEDSGYTQAQITDAISTAIDSTSAAFNLNTVLASWPPSHFSTGVSIGTADAVGFPTSLGTVVTDYASSNRAVQTFIQKQGGVFTRTANADVWTDWWEVLYRGINATPYAIAVGTLVPTTTASSGVTVTFPNGRFSAVPAVSATARSSNAVTVARIRTITTTSFNLQTYNVSGSAVLYADATDWIAIQMTSSSAAG